MFSSRLATRSVPRSPRCGRPPRQHRGPARGRDLHRLLQRAQGVRVCSVRPPRDVPRVWTLGAAGGAGLPSVPATH